MVGPESVISERDRPTPFDAVLGNSGEREVKHVKGLSHECGRGVVEPITGLWATSWWTWRSTRSGSAW